MINDKQRIAHMLMALSKINASVQCSKEEFLQSVQIQDAVSYNFLIIGEAANQVSDELKSKYPEVPWREMVSMRNILIHDYVKTNYRLIWETIQKTFHLYWNSSRQSITPFETDCF